MLQLTAALLVVALVAGCGGDEPSVPGGSGTAGSPGPAVSGATASPGSGASPAVDADGEALMPGDLISAAVETGTLAPASGLLYRLQAAAGDDRVPAEYRGPATEDDGASTLVLAGWDGFTDEQRAALLPYVVRPTDPRSIWASSGPAAGTGGGTTDTGGTTDDTIDSGRVILAAARFPETASGCVDGFLREEVPGIPMVVWGQCGGASESAVLARVEEVIADMSDLWWPMTSVMGEPLGDANDPGDSFPDPPEGADGMLDIYVVDTSVSSHGRPLDNSALATTHATAPMAGPAGAETTSSYIVVDGSAPGGAAFKSTLAHEFFHSLQFAHNNIGLMVSRPTVDGPVAWDRFWFLEASATWSEHQFVPEARSTEVYPRFTETFQSTARSLSSIKGDNEYASWVWPFFMAQENGPESVGYTWFDLEGVSGFDALQGVVGREVPFETRFRDFAVRSYNTELTPGKAIDPRFQDADPSFPQEAPAGPKAQNDVEVPVGEALNFETTLPSLWARYVDLVTDNSPKVELDFDRLSPAGSFDVDLLIKTDTGWSRRPGGTTIVCNADRIVVVLANHDPANAASVKGTWTAKGSEEACNDGNWSVTLTGGKAGAGTYSGRADGVMCDQMQDGTWQFAVIHTNTTDLRHVTGNAQSISIMSRWAMDDPSDWGAQLGMEGASISVTGDKTTNIWTMHAEASWHDVETDADLSSTVDLTCSEQHSALEGG